MSAEEEFARRNREMIARLGDDAELRELTRRWFARVSQLEYSYHFRWMGRPVIQYPQDLVATQEILWNVKPDLVIETGVAHGGSLIFYASILELIGSGSVVGVDIEIRPHNRAAIEAHPLARLVTLIEGGSTDPAIVARVRADVGTAERVLVLLDSNHSRDHVRDELEVYAPFVTPGSYIVATDGVMLQVADAPRGRPEWTDDNPVSAVRGFLANHPEFVVEQPAWPFNESELDQNVTHWPQAYLRRVR